MQHARSIGSLLVLQAWPIIYLLREDVGKASLTASLWRKPLGPAYPCIFLETGSPSHINPDKQPVETDSMD